MDLTTLALILGILAFLLSLFALIRNKPAQAQPESFSTRPLQLQAYERLVILGERMSLPSLISRVNQPGATAKEMQVYLIETIKQEFDYNASQQIYVSQAAWDALRSLRDQNLLVINKVANTLPPDARSTDLNRAILEVMMNQQDMALHTAVLNTLNAEAKKLMP